MQSFYSLVSNIQRPSDHFNGEVDLERFSEAMSCDMIGRGFVSSMNTVLCTWKSVSKCNIILCFSSPGGKHNPCAVSPTYHFWDPWIGKPTRHSDSET